MIRFQRPLSKVLESRVLRPFAKALSAPAPTFRNLRSAAEKRHNPALKRGVIVSQTNLVFRPGLQCLEIYAQASLSRTIFSRTGDNVAKAPASKKAPARRPWTKEDVRTLKGQARKEPASKIAKNLKRTEGATRQKATALGISLNTARKRAPVKKAAARKAIAKTAAPKKVAAKKAAPKKRAKA